VNGFNYFASNLDNEVHAADTLNFDASGNFTGNTNSKTWQTYTWKDSLGQCWSRTLTANAQKLTAVKDGAGCH
jgi:hypothetical protein